MSMQSSSTLSSLPNELLKHIATVVLTSDIRDVCTFALNKHIYSIMYQLWPQIARSLLVMYPADASLGCIIGSIYYGAIRQCTGPCSLRLYINEDKRGPSNVVMGIDMDYNKLVIKTRNYEIHFSPRKGMHASTDHYYRVIGSCNTTILYRGDMCASFCAYVSNLRRLVYRILPEITSLLII